MKDGFCLTYIKNGIMYPVAISKEQLKTLQVIVPSTVFADDRIQVIVDKPIGEVVNYKGLL